MSTSIIINSMPEEIRMALVEEGHLAEYSVERIENEHIVGNIYKGKVKNVLPGMQAAFVDIGCNKNAFLYTGDDPASTKQPSITVGQDVIIQISKEAIDKKGPRATMHLTLPGRYIVLMPTVEYIGISRRINDEKQRDHLKHLAEKIRPEGMGIIIRTFAEGMTEEDLIQDLKYLQGLWTTLTARAKYSRSPVLLFRDADLIIRAVRDYFSRDVDAFILDSQDAFQRTQDLAKTFSPELVPRIKRHESKEDIFTFHGLDSEISTLHDRHIELTCGGYIVIDKTEALTVIDVNTGKFTGQTNLSETVFKTNIQAALMIAMQIRLRDIGGIIIIDFIDMDKPEHQKAVIAALEQQVKKDRTKTHILGFTELGLLEMTRKKSSQNLDNKLYIACPCCNGRGRIQSPVTLELNIRRELRKLCGVQRIDGRIIIQVNPRLADYLIKQGHIDQLSRELSCNILVQSVPEMNDEVFSLLRERK